MEKHILCLGILVADVIGAPLRAVPDPGRLVLVDEMSLHIGGCAVNAATALARLGLPVEIMGKIGHDPFGDFLLSSLAEIGIGIGNLKRDPEIGTSATMVMVEPDGERRFVHYIGANAKFTLDDVDFSVLDSAAVLHLAGSLVLPGLDGEPTAELLRQAQNAGVTTFLDVVWDDTGRWMDLIGSSLPYIDYFVPSLPEAVAITGRENPTDAARKLIDHGVGTVAIKMDVDGCLVMTSSGLSIHQPAFQVDVVDATGAGDAFAAGFVAGVYLDWPLEKTARFANAVGALCVTGLGAAGGVCSMEETLEFMQETPLRQLESTKGH